MTIEGVVEQGKHLGRTLGYPTANIRPLRLCGDWPQNGVYVAALWVEGDERAWLGMLNQGVHPTVPEGKPTVEVHLPGFTGDIYDRAVRVEYLSFVRPERRFESLGALRTQLAEDLRRTGEWLADALVAAEPDAGQRRAREIAWHKSI